MVTAIWIHYGNDGVMRYTKTISNIKEGWHTMRKLILTVGVIGALSLASTAYAVALTPSDYSQDVTAGQNELKNDPAAKNNAVGVNGNEDNQAQVDNGQVAVDETVGSQEASMGDSQAGETMHGEASTGQSETTPAANGGSTSSDGGSSQGAQQ